MTKELESYIKTWNSRALTAVIFDPVFPESELTESRKIGTRKHVCLWIIAQHESITNPTRDGISPLLYISPRGIHFKSCNSLEVALPYVYLMGSMGLNNSYNFRIENSSEISHLIEGITELNKLFPIKGGNFLGPFFPRMLYA